MNFRRMPAAVVAVAVLSAGLIAVFSAAPAHAQPFPATPVRLVAPFPPGGSVDAVARMIAPGMSASLDQNVIIDNRAGASGNIGMEFVAREGADVVASTPEAFRARIATDTAMWARVVREMGIRAE